MLIERITRHGTTWFLLLCEIAAIASVSIIPKTSDNLFNRNIIFGHLIMVLPLMIPSFRWETEFLEFIAFRKSNKDKNVHIEFAKIVAMYGFVAGTSLLYHLNSTVNLLESFITKVPHTLSLSTLEELGVEFVQFLSTHGWSHHAQSSISFDLVFITLECCIYFILEGGFFGLVLASLTPFFSVATTFPAFLIWREFKIYR